MCIRRVNVVSGAVKRQHVERGKYKAQGRLVSNTLPVCVCALISSEVSQRPNQLHSKALRGPSSAVGYARNRN